MPTLLYTERYEDLFSRSTWTEGHNMNLAFCFRRPGTHGAADAAQEGATHRNALLHAVRAVMVRPLGDDFPRDEDGVVIHRAAHIHVSGVLSDSEGAVAFRQHSRTHGNNELLWDLHLQQR